MPRQNLAARAGRWSAQHRKRAILGWILFVILATVIGGATGVRNLADEDMGNGESQRADRIVASHGPAGSRRRRARRNSRSAGRSSSTRKTMSMIPSSDRAAFAGLPAPGRTTS